MKSIDDSSLPDTILTRLAQLYAGARDPGSADGMTAYMRGQFPFLGISAPERRSLSRMVTAGLPRPDEDQLRVIVRECWELPEREYQYFGCDYLQRQVRVCSSHFLDTVHVLIATKSWWDTVDPLAAHVVGPLVTQHPVSVTVVDRWALDSSPWLARTALLHQLYYRRSTDADRLFRYCTELADRSDFFVRKAIGWALREYAKTHPSAVRHYVTTHRDHLSPLSVREALKNLPQTDDDAIA